MRSIHLSERVGTGEVKIGQNAGTVGLLEGETSIRLECLLTSGMNRKQLLTAGFHVEYRKQEWTTHQSELVTSGCDAPRAHDEREWDGGCYLKIALSL